MWHPDEVEALAGCRRVEGEQHVFSIQKSYKDTWDFIDDRHSMVSWMAGMIGPFHRGAAACLEERWMPDETRLCLSIRTTLRVEKIDHQVARDQLDIICNPAILKKAQASHVIAAITYGLESRCVFQLDGVDETDREDAVEFLHVAACRFRDGLLDSTAIIDPPLSPFRPIKVKLFTDWDAVPSIQLSYCDAYRLCYDKLSSASLQSAAVPLTVSLCPVSLIRPTITKTVYRPISDEYVAGCLHFFIRFSAIQSATRQLPLHPFDLDDKAIQQFDSSTTQFRRLFQNRMAELVKSVRAGSAEDAFSKSLSIIEESIFNTDVLYQWFSWRRFWSVMYQKMEETLPGVPVCSNDQHLDDQQPIVILQMPRPFPVYDPVIEEMASYVRNNVTLARCPPLRQADLQVVTAFQNLFQHSENAVTFSFNKLAKFISENKESSSKPKFSILIGDGQDLPSFQLHHDGSTRPFILPSPPDNVHFEESRRGKLVLAWSPVDQGQKHVTNYLVEYRCVDETNWTRIPSGLTVSIQLSGLVHQKQYCCRVATETVAGRSAFGLQVGPEMVRSVCDPPGDISCFYVTEDTIKIRWADPPVLDFAVALYDVEYWPEVQPERLKMATSQKVLKLDRLQPDTTYNIRVAAVCGVEGSSPFSVPVKISTRNQPERVAFVVREVSSLADGSPDPATGMSVYNVLLQPADENGLEHRIFGFQNLLAFQRKTILMVGASGVGKTTLINAMFNHILDVQWEDDFRFKLIQEPKLSQTESQTKNVTAYDLFHVKGSRVDYSLTIVDTPGFGDTRGLERDEEIREEIRRYFSQPGGIQQVEAVCFVVKASSSRLTQTQRYVFESIMSIFGKDIRDNIRIMVTFADGSEPPVLAAIEEAKIPYPLDSNGRPFHHKFNSSGYFATDERDPFNSLYFRMGLKNFKDFFHDLYGMKTTSLTLTKEVLEERKRIVVVVEGLQQLIHTGLVKIEELKQMKKILNDHESELAANQDFTFELESVVAEQKEVSHFALNCRECCWTCHSPCSEGEDPSACFAMDLQGNCKICPGRCSYSNHSTENYKWEQVAKKTHKSSEDVRQKFQSAIADGPATCTEILEQLSNQLRDFKGRLLELAQTAHPLIQRLNEIALRPHPLSAPDYIDLMIAVETQERRTGYLTRIENLQKLGQNAALTRKLINNEEVFDADVANDQV